jgi:hypothetical protein
VGVCSQTGPPVAQLIAAVLQTSIGWQLASGPSTQLTHAPAEQTWSVPQKVPSGAPTQLPQTPP